MSSFAYLFHNNLGRACLTATLLTACGPDKADTTDEQATSTGEPGGSSTSDTPTSDTPTSDTATSGSSSETSTGEGPAPDACEGGVAVTQIVVEFGVPEPACEMEFCESHREAACIVSDITSEGPTRVTLACEYPNTGPATDVVILEPVPGGTLDLAVGGAVQLTYDSWSAFEGGDSGQLRLTDDRGLVLGTGGTQRYGGGSGDTQWAKDWLGELAAPLTADIVSQGCPDDETRGAITIRKDEASVVVTEGGSALLTADDTWLVIAETASISFDGVADGRLRVAILRVLP